jgi:fatty acid desaturase
MSQAAMDRRAGGFRRTLPRDPARPPATTEYSALLSRVRGEGLLSPKRGYYATLFGILTLALTACIGAVLVVGDSWWQLLIALPLGVVLTQFAFLAHEAAHRQVFVSGKRNDLAALMIGSLVVGMSYSAWIKDHARHHGKPNTLGLDPAVAKGVVAFTPEDAATSKPAFRWFTRSQGYFFFPLLLLEGLNLHVGGFVTLVRNRSIERRGREIALLSLRALVYATFIVFVMHVAIGLAFLAVQLATFGLYIGSTFAPNHVGMPILNRDTKIDFLTRQVTTARNISGQSLTTLWMGGLNYQIEHHLFPSMARPQLKRASVIVRSWCDERDIPYSETSLPQAWGIIVRHMNEVGIAAGSRFECPAARALGR